MNNTKIISYQDINFCILSLQEYTDIYYEKMINVGWKPIIDSMRAHYILAKESIYALKYDGKIIATLSAAKSSGYGIAYMGFFTVDQEWRGKGVGKLLWKRAENLLRAEGYKIEFDSPEKLTPYYQALEYKEATTMTIWALKNKAILQDRLENDNHIYTICSENIDGVIEYDKTILQNENRKYFLHQWLNKQDTIGICHIYENVVMGYGILSKYLRGKEEVDSYILAPVFAKNAEIASAIIKSLCQRVNNDASIYLDTLNYYSTPAKLVTDLGFEEVALIKRLSETGKLEGVNRGKTAQQVYVLSSHGYAPF